MDLTCQREAQVSWIAKFSGILSGWIVLSVIFYSNLADGAARPFPLFLTQLLVIACILFQIPLVFSKGNYFGDFFHLLLRPAAFFFAFLLVIATQYFLGRQILETGMGTVNPHATLSSMVQLIFYFFFFILCVQFTAHAQNIEKLVFFMAILVFGVTMWGIAERFAGRDLFGPDHLAQDSFGPFVNPNHYSAFAGLSLPLFLVYLHYRFTQSRAISLWKKILDLLDSGIFFLVFLIALVLAGCFLSGSRLGAIIVFFSLTLYLIMSGIRRHFKPICLSALLAISGTFLVLKSAGLESTFRTFGLDSLRAAAVERFQVSKESLEIFFQYPLLGSGLGTYAFISPKVITVLSDSIHWDHAHNDYAELLAETGAVGFFLFMAALAMILFYGIRHAWNSPSPWTRLVLRQSVFAVFSIAIMAAADFPLKIPSLAFFFLMQLAILTHSHNRESGFKPLSLFAKYCVGGVYLAAALFLGNWAFKNYQAFAFTQSTEGRIQSLEKAVEIQPMNAAYWHQLGWEYLAGEQRALGEGVSKTKALEAFQKAAHLSPTFSRYWFSLGRLEYREGRAQQAIFSVKQAAAWAPHQSGYWLHLIALYLEASEKSETAQEKEQNLQKARELFEKLSNMKNFPDAVHQQRWMGQVYAEKFQQLIPHWNLNRKAGL